MGKTSKLGTGKHCRDNVTMLAIKLSIIAVHREIFFGSIYITLLHCRLVVVMELNKCGLICFGLRRRIYTKSKANSRRGFLRENGLHPLQDCVQQTSQASKSVTNILMKKVALEKKCYTVFRLSGSILDIHSKGKF